MADTIKTSLRELRLSPRKVSLVVALVRGRTVDDAIVILSHTPRRAAKPVKKLIESARSNAINNHGLKSEGLRIAKISVSAGARLKRYRPVSRGMAHPFQKRTSHIFVEIIGDIKPAKKSAKVEHTEEPTAVETGNNSKKETK
jgi:large subunit ribosomal protein L22